MSEPHTLVINRSDSKCGNCGLPADPYEACHDTSRSWSETRPGCGQRFALLRSDYIGPGMREAAMRPDLAWVGFE